jgi:hypothetical protein
VIGVENELEACTEEPRAPGATESRPFQPLA